MFQFLTSTRAGCRREFPRRLLHRITTLAISALAVATLQTLYSKALFAESTTRPNIVFIMADDMGYGDPGCYNADSKAPTPNINRLAREGIRFTDAHAPAAVCVPTRYGLMTGRYPFRMKTGRGPLIAEDRLTVARLLREQGYRTGMVGKWHLGVDHEKDPQPNQILGGGPAQRGFKTFFGIPASLDIPPYYYIRGNQAVAPPSLKIGASNTDGWTRIQGAFWREGGIAPGYKHEEVLPTFTAEAEAFLKAASPGKPFFLYLALPAPHTPWLPLKPFLGKSKAGIYGDFVAQVDDTVGRVLEVLDNRKLAENTIVIFTSDNGPVWYDADEKKFGHASTGPFRGMKGDAWEGGHRMPFVVRWPGVAKAGSTSDVTICHTDFLATAADVLDVTVPEGQGQDSVSFAAVLKDGSKKQNRETTIHQSSGRVLALRSGDWKLIPSLGSGGFSQPRKERPVKGGPKGQLYNLRTDPGETTNLYLENPELVTKLSKQHAEITGR
jgi:arylsulfatase A-like enzyme